MCRNVILICLDELRGDCIGIAGHRHDVRTPHIDALLAGGAVFRNHFCVMPKCVPSRISMMTGRYTHTDGFRTIHQHLPADHPDLVSTLKRNGYGVAVFGINHCWEDGFERVMDVHAWTPPFDRHWGPESPFKRPMPETAGRPVPDIPETYDYRGCSRRWFDDTVTQCALEFIEDDARWNRPWYLQINLQAPHPPYQVEEPYFSMFPDGSFEPFPHEMPTGAPSLVAAQRRHRTDVEPNIDDLLEIQRVYFGMIAKADHLVGQIADALRRTGRLEDSLVVFFSDHGDYAGQYGLVEKWDTHFPDPLVRVAFGMVGDGIEPHTAVDSLTEHIDVGPTVLDWLGLEPLPNAHGRSLLNTLAGTESRKAVFADGGHEPPMRDRFNTPVEKNIDREVHIDGKQLTYRESPEAMARAKMVRTHTHKLVIRETGDHELYDLVADPHELINLYGGEGTLDIERELMHLMLEWVLRTDPDYPFQAEVGA
ncbi:MAG: sulfatase-like hydrolase/transferase [Fimbriimonadaceae bacterium]